MWKGQGSPAASPSAYMIDVDKLNVEGLSGLPWEQKGR